MKIKMTTRKYQILLVGMLLITIFMALYSQNIVFPETTQESVNQFWISLGTDFLSYGIITVLSTFIIVKNIKRGRQH